MYPYTKVSVDWSVDLLLKAESMEYVLVVSQRGQPDNSK